MQNVLLPTARRSEKDDVVTSEGGEPVQVCTSVGDDSITCVTYLPL